jgi:hypothetical protein
MQKKLWFVYFIAILAILLTVSVFANSAEPPKLLIIVENAPDDFAISWIVGETEFKGQKNTVAWESYYSFYDGSLYDIFGQTYEMEAKKIGVISLKVFANGETFEIGINSSELTNSYNRIFTLDINNRTVTQGKLLLRSIILVGLRVLLTLIIEGVIFFLFKFRNKRSWIAFLIINLITQGWLNIMLNNDTSPLTSNVYIILGLFIYEFIILIVEMIAFGFAVNEHKKWRVLLYVLAANTASFILGGILLSYLPV